MENQIGETKSVDDAILESIDEVLTAIGASAKNIVYLYLTKELGISKQEIPSKTDEFMNAMHKIFGAGARVIELKLIKQITVKTKVAYPFSIQTSTLQSCVVYIRQEQSKVKQKGLF